MNFLDKLQMTLMDRKKLTENGAVGYETSKSALVDINFAAASLRNASEEKIIRQFILAFHEDRVLAMKWLFFLRDAREGLGERRSFRVIIRYLATAQTAMVEALAEVMAEYGRFDDLLVLLDTPAEDRVLSYLALQLKEDEVNREKGKPVSLCAKWMPGNNASSAATRKQAVKLQQAMGLTARQYRKLLAGLRAHLKVTEVYMSANRWEEIDYSAVASKANVLYRKAFMKHDQERREAFLAAVERGEKTIHAQVLMPHDIVSRYMVREGWQMRLSPVDAALEALWKNLSDQVRGAENVLCVVDGSGSMLCPVGNTNITALHVANALGIYFSERMAGVYRDKFITFSNTPRYVDLSRCQNLREKLELAFSHNEISNTNIEATFDLILKTAVKNRLRQAELPGAVLIISDMEFDAATRGQKVNNTLFGMIAARFGRYGYKMPRLIFWNVNSRTGVVPLQENQLGVALVSGFSVNICKMVLSGELSPYKVLVETLNSPRYEVIEKYVS